MSAQHKWGGHRTIGCSYHSPPSQHPPHDETVQSKAYSFQLISYNYFKETPHQMQMFIATIFLIKGREQEAGYNILDVSKNK